MAEQQLEQIEGTVEDQVRKFKIISIPTFYFDCLSGCASSTSCASSNLCSLWNLRSLPKSIFNRCIVQKFKLAQITLLQ